MIESYDVGSLPFIGDAERFSEGATRFWGLPTDDSVGFFERRVIEGFLDKAKVGIDIPNYPQFRDMNETFLNMIKGVEKRKGYFVETGILSIKEGKGVIPEVAAIKRGAPEIRERLGRPFNMKICVTGPYTLSSLFRYKDKGIFSRLGSILSKIVESSVFGEKSGRVTLVAVDEPVFGFLDDPLLDPGSEGRENLREAWEHIFRKAASKGAKTCLHLHNTANELFWDVKSLHIIESHVDDSLYHSKRTKELLESTDKFLKASICVADYNILIKGYVCTTLPKRASENIINEKVSEAWRDVVSGKLDPKLFLQNVKSMRKSMTSILNRFGVERVPYAGPECGLKGFPTYESALECLQRTSKAVKRFNI